MKIVYQRADGGVSIVTPADKRTVPGFQYSTDEEFLNHVISKSVPADASNVRIVEDHEIPADRTFRDALTPDLTFDKPKCVEITKDRLRKERAPLLIALDAEYLQALEKGKPVKHLTDEKQRLRDITTLPHAGMSLDELKALRC